MKKTIILTAIVAMLLAPLAVACDPPTKAPRLTQTIYKTGLVRYHKPTIFRVEGRPGAAYGLFLSKERAPGIRTAWGVDVPIRLYTETMDLDPLLATTFALANTQYFPNFFGHLDPSGRAWPVINMPAFGWVPQFIGLEFYAVALTTNGYRYDLRVSNSLPLLISE